MIYNNKILAITLARGGSKRVPRKNITIINNQTLLQYTTDEVKKSKYIDNYIVSTDDEQIINVCKSLNVNYHIRPSELASDTSTSASGIKDVIDKYSDYNIIIEIMCTNPLKTVEDIDNCIEKLVNTNSDSIVSVVKVWDHHPSRLKFIKNEQLHDFYPEIPESRRQDLTPPAYIRNGSIYAFWKESFLKYNNRLGKICRPYIMPQEKTINIDEPNDLIMAKILINNNITNNYTNYCSKLDGGCNNDW